MPAQFIWFNVDMCPNIVAHLHTWCIIPVSLTLAVFRFCSMSAQHTTNTCRTTQQIYAKLSATSTNDLEYPISKGFVDNHTQVVPCQVRLHHLVNWNSCFVYERGQSSVLQHLGFCNSYFVYERVRLQHLVIWNSYFVYERGQSSVT